MSMLLSGQARLSKLERTKPFSDTEAWKVFKVAAISEAVGWSLLILGILVQRYVTPQSGDPVKIAGQIHGIIFFGYFVAVLGVYSSLNWSRKRTVVAGAISVLPYGTLLFEQWEAHRRQRRALQSYREVFVSALIINGDNILAIQPRESGFWNAPGGVVGPQETVEAALYRLVKLQTGINPTLERLAYIRQYRQHTTERMELFFIVSNVSAFNDAALKARHYQNSGIDELAYVPLKGNADLRPSFLHTQSIAAECHNKIAEVKFIASHGN
jgi:integral membrane protein